MNGIWFPFIVAVQFAYVVCSADDQNVSNLRTMEVNDRIFKGEDTPIENFPYQVSLTIIYEDPTNHKKKGDICGGGIINPKVIITAGHCVHDENIIEVKVRAGTAFPDIGGVEIKVEQFIIHESFEQELGTSGELRHLDYDVALLKLSKDLKYTKYIQNIPFANQGDNLAVGDMGIVAGWGYTFGTNLANVLQKTILPVMSSKKCRGKLLSKKYSLTLNDRLFCSGYNTKDTSNICVGDSGGPFVKNNKIYGIVSAALTDCKGAPSITFVTNTSSVHEWIAANVEALSSDGSTRGQGGQTDAGTSRCARCRIL